MSHGGQEAPAPGIVSFDGEGDAGQDMSGTSCTPIVMQDRGAPRWAMPLVAVFSGGMAAMIAALCTGALFVTTLVVEAREPVMAPILAGLSLIPALGFLILAYAQARALAGYRLYRERWGEQAEAGVAVIAVAAMAFLHPLLAAAPLLAGLAGVAAIRLAERAAGAGEPLWDFNPAESVPILSGRDALGLRLASAARRPALLGPVLRGLRWLALAGAFCAAAWLAARDVLAPAAVPATALLAYWALGPVLAVLRRRSRIDPARAGLAAEVCVIGRGQEEGEPVPGGLDLCRLTVETAAGTPILSDVSLRLKPGEILGIDGPPGAGKTTLARAIVAPADLAAMTVRGSARLGEEDLWRRSATPGVAPAMLVESEPALLPASGGDNLAFFDHGTLRDRGQRILEQLVFAADTAERICAATDATRLSAGERKALGFARAFLLSPPLLILDRPEDGASDKLVTALAARLRQEVRAGRSAILITGNRALLDLCDRLLVLSEGRVVDDGPAAEIRARTAAGWLRFVGARSLETEETLETWVRSHFRRDGDEANRRRACMVAAELLALSCAGVAPLSRQTFALEFKHFEGHCLLRMRDDDIPVSSAALERARAEVDRIGTGGQRARTPLATLMQLCESIEPTTEQDKRVLTARIATYDPRKTGGKPPATPEISDRQNEQSSV